MGDTGSNLLGYLLGAIAVQGALKTNAVVALILPLVVLAVPILDTGFVIAKRIKYRQPIYRADRWHLHHRMANIGFSQRRTLAYLYGWALVMAGAGAGAALRPLLRRPRQLRPAVDGGDDRLRARRARRQRLPGDHARDPEAAADAARASWSAPGSPAGARRSSTRASPASWRPAASRRSIPRPASSRPIEPRSDEPRSGAVTKLLQARPRRRGFPAIVVTRPAPMPRTGGCSVSPWEILSFRPRRRCLAATSTTQMTRTLR